MKRTAKRIWVVPAFVLGMLLILLTICYIYHQVQLLKEEQLFEPIGTQVVVNNHSMNVYTEGAGETTLVFLSGGGTCSPVLDFKSLYSLLSDTLRVAVVEKAGYGFSEVTADTPRDIDTVLFETRKALELAGVTAPYILCPHSMSGIEALYWAQKYPQEITAIIGLDMAVPSAYADYKLNLPVLKLGAFAANIGLTRWLPGASESDAIRFGSLTEEDKALYRAVFYKRTATADMLREVQEIKTSAQKVAGGQTPNLPILLFVSNGAGTGWSELAWREYQQNYASTCPNGTVIPLDCSHYVHDIEYDNIAKEIRRYIGGLE